jgi:hypothetical protein
MFNLVASNLQAVTFFLYNLVGVMLCYAIQKWLYEKEDQQRNAEEKVHFIVMSFLVVFVLIRLVRLFCGDVLLYPATMWGYFALIFCSYSTIYRYREKLLLPFFKSKAVSLVAWVGGRLEREIYREGVGCILIVILILIVIIFTTVDIITIPRILLFLPIGMYLSLRSIALIDEPLVYIQEVESIKRLRSIVGKFDADDRFYIPLILMLLFLGILAVALVGMCVAAPELPGKSVFKKGCLIIVQECTKLKILIITF